MDENDAPAAENEEERLAMLRKRIREAQERVSPYLRPGQSLADELIADRRREAERE
jgi:hypothetical protein